MTPVHRRAVLIEVLRAFNPRQGDIQPEAIQAVASRDAGGCRFRIGRSDLRRRSQPAAPAPAPVSAPTRHGSAGPALVRRRRGR